MADQIIPGRHSFGTLVSDSYGASIHTAPPEPPEDPSRWKAAQLTDDEICDGRGWTRQQLGIARAQLNFPVGREFVKHDRWSWRNRYFRKTDLEDIQRWEEHARACGLLK